MEWPSGKYGAILADPPWRFETRGARAGTGGYRGPFRCADRHYPTMTQEAIRTMPVIDLAADDCALFLWITAPNLQEGLSVITSWGFTFKTFAFVWAKMTRSMTANNFAPKWHIGLGYWTRANAELCLLATRGKPQRLDKGVRQLIVSPVREHSRKPDEQYERIERLVAGPYLELFARQARPGWDRWGNEAPADDDLAAV